MFTALTLYLLTRRPKTAAVVLVCLLPVVLCAGPRKKELREEVERLTLELAECQANSYAATPCPEVIRAIAEDGEVSRNERKVVKAIMRDHRPVRVAKQARKRGGPRVPERTARGGPHERLAQPVQVAQHLGHCRHRRCAAVRFAAGRWRLGGDSSPFGGEINDTYIRIMRKPRRKIAMNTGEGTKSDHRNDRRSECKPRE